MITHGMIFVEPVGGTGWSKSVTHSQWVNGTLGQGEQNRAGANHQSPNHEPC